MSVKKKTNTSIKKSSKNKIVNDIALLPLLVFLILYLGLGITFEYVLKIPMGFYNIPIVVMFLVSLIVACIQNKKLPIDKKLEIMGYGIGDKNIITMLLIFLLAGMFIGVVGRGSAASVAYFVLSHIPVKYGVAVLFIVSCFISLSMGTSVGTITLVTPIAYELSIATDFSIGLSVAAVVGGAMFGDNLSFISDTTIAACNGQGCDMKDKFRENVKIAIPSAIITLIIILVISFGQNINMEIEKNYELIQILPYLLVLIGGIIGINVFIVLIIGIISGYAVMILTSNTNFVELLTQMGNGVSGMFETIIVAILVASLGALIKEYGGFDAIIYHIKNVFKGKKGGLFGIAILVSLIDIATANNTIAIVMANPIAKELSKEYGIKNTKVASILDTFSCVMQGIIPYGAQILVAISAVASLGEKISAFDIIKYLYYPFVLAIFSIIFIIFEKSIVENKKNKK